MARLREPGSVEALIPLLADHSSEIRRSASIALPQIDPDWRSHRVANTWASPLVSMLQSEDAAARLSAAEALTELPVQRAGTALVKLLRHDKDSRVRPACARALGVLGDRRALTLLLTAVMEDADEEVRVQAVVALGEIEDRRAIAPLFDLLRRRNASPYDPLVMVGVRALRRCGGIAQLIELLKLDLSGVAFRVERELEKMTGKNLDDSSAWVRWWEEYGATLQPTRNEPDRLPIIFGSTGELCKRVFADYDLNNLSCVVLITAVRLPPSHARPEDRLAAVFNRNPTLRSYPEISTIQLAEPLTVLLRQLRQWDDTTVLRIFKISRYPWSARRIF
jgi:HEAT repeat protein